MKALIYFLDRICRFCNTIARAVLVGAGMVMAVVIFFQVVFRYSISIPLPWSEEIARYLMIWIGMMGASLALHEGRHIGVDVVMERLPGSLRRFLAGAALLGVLWFLWVMVREGGVLALQNYSQLSPAMMIPMLFPYAAIPVGGIFMLIQALGLLLHLIHDRRVAEG